MTTKPDMNTTKPDMMATKPDMNIANSYISANVVNLLIWRFGKTIAKLK
jgi:hypothetical protein